MKRLVVLAAPAIALAVALSMAQAAQAEVESPGQALFVERCGGCHLEGGFGTRVLSRRAPEGQAELEKRELLPASFTISAVRRGIGSMPQIRAAELSNADLRAIADYLAKRP